MIADQITRRFLDTINIAGDEVNPNLIVYSVDNRLLGFAKIHLANPRHGLDLLEGRSLVI